MSVTSINGSRVSIPSLAPSRASNISEIAFRILKELAASLAIGAAVACFTAPASAPLLFQAIAVQFTASLFFQTMKVISSEKIQTFFDWAAGVSFALFTGYNAQVLIHEAGHAFSTLAVYSQTTPKIELSPFGSAITQFQKGPLSTFGKKIGPASATCLVTASGPLLTLLVSSALFAIGLSLKKHYPAFSKYLICWSLLDYVCTAHYAYSAIGNESFNLSHDFVHLSIFGLSPVVATISVIAIPVILASASALIK